LCYPFFVLSTSIITLLFLSYFLFPKFLLSFLVCFMILSFLHLIILFGM
jgi:hypothetical protein